MTAIIFLYILNLVTKSTIPRESLMSAKGGQLESSAALSLDHLCWLLGQGFIQKHLQLKFKYFCYN